MKKITSFILLFWAASAFSFLSFGQVPDNDTCGTAIAINCDQVISGSNVSATTTGAPSATCGTTAGGPGVWYTFAGNGDTITASTCGSSIDTKIQVYEGNCSGLVCVGGNDDSNSCGSWSLQSEYTFDSTDGATYFIYVYGYGSSDTGSFQLSLTCVPFVDPTVFVDCSAGPTTQELCYTNSTVNTYIYTSLDGSPLNLSVLSGEVESCCDDFIVLDTDGTVLYTGNGASGNLAGLSFQSSGDTITIQVDADSSLSCSSSASIDPINVSVACATCENPTASYTLVSDCANGPQFNVDVNISSLGSSAELVISDDQGGATQTVSATGIVTMGPYPNGTSVSFTVASSSDANCSIVSSPLGQDICLENIVDCAVGPVTTNFCYENSTLLSIEYTSSDGSPLSLNILSGEVENNWDALIVLDTDGTELYNGYGASGNLAGLSFQSSGDTITIQVDADSSASCSSSSSIDPISVSVACATCENPSVTYALMSDCTNGEQFVVNVDITSLGSATTLNITDDYGSTAQTVTATGSYVMGPYPNGTSVQVFTTNSADGNCLITSPVLTQAVCPPDNDICATATTIECGEIMTGNTSQATSNGAPTGFCGTGTGAPGVWYVFEGTDEIITATLCGSDYDTKIKILEGSCGALDCVTGNDDSCGVQSEVVFIASAGTTYYIYVYGYGSSTGDYELILGCEPVPDPPVNDECSGAIVLIANDGEECVTFESGTIYGASASAEANSCFGTDDDDVWFSFEAVTTDAAVTLSNIVGSTTDLYHVLYEGDDCSNLTQLYCSDDENSVANGLTVGATYFVRVYSWTSNPLQNVTFDICVFAVPPPVITSTNLYTADELVRDILLGGDDCGQIFNVTSSTGSDFGDVNGIGYFDRNGSSWPFDNGLVLSSGNVDDITGPESGTISDGGWDWPGDSDLEANVSTVDAGDSNNASIVEFDFIPVVDYMSFDFIFASEEYGTFQCDYSDAFAFLLTYPDGSVLNLAKVPGTDDEVSVFSVRDEAYNDWCDSVNPEWFDMYYGDGGQPPLSDPINIIGYTKVMTAAAEVIPGELYHIKLVIADALDDQLDSAVFIGGGTFRIGSPDLGEDILLSSGNANCQGEEVIVTAYDSPDLQPPNSVLTWYQDGVLIDEATGNLSWGVTETGYYSVGVTINGTTCTFEDEVLIEFFPVPVVEMSDDSVVKCANEDFVLEAIVTNLNTAFPAFGDLIYTWYDDGEEVQSGPSSTYTLTAAEERDGMISVTVTDSSTGCGSEATAEVAFYENSYCVDIPQGLSPNGDGVNDCVILDHLDAEEDIADFVVYNRYGTEVFRKTEYVKEWCGTDQSGGEILPVGTYFYIVTFRSEKDPIRSWIYINY